MYHYKRKKRNTYWITLLSLIALSNIIIFPKQVTKPLWANVAYANFLNSSASSQDDWKEVDFSNDLYIDENQNQLYYVVQWTDTLASIAQSFWLTTSQLKQANNLDSNVVSAGQKLLITKDEWFIITLDRNIIIDEFAKKYWIDVQKFRSTNYVWDTTNILDSWSEVFLPMSPQQAMEKWIIDKPEAETIQSAQPAIEAKTQQQTQAKKTITTTTKKTTTTTTAKKSDYYNTNGQPTALRPVSNKWYNSSIRNWFVVWQCTWYVAIKKFPYISSSQQSRPWWWNWGQWYRNAAAAGYKVWKTPQVWAIIVLNYWSYYGHVWIVKAIDWDKVLVESMNYKWPFIVSTHRENARWGATIWYVYY